MLSIDHGNQYIVAKEKVFPLASRVLVPNYQFSDASMLYILPGNSLFVGWGNAVGNVPFASLPPFFYRKFYIGLYVYLRW